MLVRAADVGGATRRGALLVAEEAIRGERTLYLFELLAAGCDEHLAKPATSDRLNEVLAEVPPMGSISG